MALVGSGFEVGFVSQMVPLVGNIVAGGLPGVERLADGFVVENFGGVELVAWVSTVEGEVHTFELVFYRLWGTNDHRMDLVSRLGAGLRRPAAGHQQHPQALNRSITRFRNSGCLPASSRPSCSLSVDAVRLPALLAA